MFKCIIKKGKIRLDANWLGFPYCMLYHFAMPGELPKLPHSMKHPKKRIKSMKNGEINKTKIDW